MSEIGECPTSKNGYHYLQPFQVKTAFEFYRDENMDVAYGKNKQPLYELVEYHYTSCACGAGKKERVGYGATNL